MSRSRVSFFTAHSALQVTSTFTPPAAHPAIRSFRIASLYAPSLVILTLLGFGLRLVLLDQYPLREDEAIYSFWALHFWHVDPQFLTVWPDKPPVFLWLLSITFRLFGTSQASARWLSVMVSTLTIPIVAATARHFWGRCAALFAAVVYTTNLAAWS